MNKLEHYLHQVCRSMGGPKALRDHVRQELREHLLDAAAQHQAAGLSEEAALDRAIDEFGKPDAVRTELEATHGHRTMMAVVLDTAMQWKENTMKAKWFWATLTYLTVIALVVFEIVFCFFSMIYILPKLKKLKYDGLYVTDEGTRPVIEWMFNFLGNVADVYDRWVWWVLGFLVIVWGLFEWRVKSESKSYMRLWALGSIAAALAVLMAVMSVSMVLPFTLSTPYLARMTQPWAVQEFAGVDTSLIDLQEAMKKSDSLKMAYFTVNLQTRLRRLAESPALPSLLQRGQPYSLDQLHAMLDATRKAVTEMEDAIRENDPKRLEKAMQSLEKAYAPLKEAVKQPEAKKTD